MVTTDPLNYVLESLRTHLASNVTDPASAIRPSAFPWIQIDSGSQRYDHAYPLIILKDIGGTTTVPMSGGDVLNSTQQAKYISYPIQALAITPEGQIFGAKSNGELLRNLSSQVVNALVKKSQKATLLGSYAVSYTHLTLPTNREV